MKDVREGGLHLLAIDCCEHVVKALSRVPGSRLTGRASKEGAQSLDVDGHIDLIVVGVSRLPVRRLFIGSLRHIYPDTPMLILRLEGGGEGERETGDIRGEFILTDRNTADDCALVRAVRTVFPLPACPYSHKAQNFDVVQRVIRVIVDRYADPSVDLAAVAKELGVSTTRLSRILNRQAGVSFRHLLRHVRIEEAKKLLASRRYSVKEVANRVGFSDRHYFSRSFKELTGRSASEFRAYDAIFG